ncbi:MAG: SMP-30/gluconolactonase/LRE family protein, partial [Phycisphaeraceae bacterium]|nr:SMP-30/gluconolactonase/LRE family protein [Phycisphaeraceae bacterium]
MAMRHGAKRTVWTAGLGLAVSAAAALATAGQPGDAKAPAETRQPEPAKAPAPPIASAAPAYFESDKPEVIVQGLRFTEGPVWHEPSGALFFSDMQLGGIYRWTEKNGHAPVREKVQGACGNAIDGAGRLLTAQFTGKLERAEIKDGALGEPELVADRYNTKKLSALNDVVVKRDGSVCFTDFRGRDGEVKFSGVFMLRPAGGELVVLSRDCARPNGLAFSPDEKRLYVADSGSNKIWAYDVKADGTTENGRVLCEAAEPGARGIVDGLKVEAGGGGGVGGGGGGGGG